MKSNVIVVVVSLFCALAPLRSGAQGFEQMHPAYPVSLMRSALMLGADSVVAVGHGGTVMVSSDRGKTWKWWHSWPGRDNYADVASMHGQLYLLPLPAPRGYEQPCLVRFDVQTGAFERLPITAPDTSWTTWSIESIHATDDGLVTLALKGTAVNRATLMFFDSQLHRVQTASLPDSIDVRDAYMCARSDMTGIVQIVSRDSSKTRRRFFRWEGRGAQWSEILNMENRSTGPYPVQWVSDSILCIVADNSLFWSTDAGRTWKQSGSPLAQSGLMHMMSDGTGYAVGSGTTDVYRTTNTGSTWRNVPPYYFLNTLASIMIDAPTVIVFGDDGSLFRTDDAGATWDLVHSSEIPQFGRAYFSNMNNGVALLRKNGAAGVYSTSNGGRSWTAVTIENSSGVRFHPVDAQTWFLLNPDLTRLLTRTTDGGKTWTLLLSKDTLTASSLWDLWVRGTDTILVRVGSSSVVRSTDAGTSWHRMGNVPTSGGPVIQLDLSHSGSGWAATGPNKLWKTTDDGATWVQIPVPAEVRVINLMQVFDNGSTIAVSHANSRSVSTDAGATWETYTSIETVQSPGFSTYGMWDQWMQTSALGWGWSKPEGLYVTRDGWKTGTLVYPYSYFRATWQFQVAGFTLDERTRWFFGLNGLVLRTTDGGVNWISHSAEIASACSIAAMYPQPVAGRGSTHLVLRRTGRTEARIRVTVTDMLGRIVAVPFDDRMHRDEHVVVIDTGALPRGGYLVHVDDGMTRTSRTLVVQ